MAWSLLVCEGAHDEEFIVTIALASGKWQLSARMPQAVPGAFRASGMGPFKFLVSNNGVLVVRGLGGVTKVLGDMGRALVSSSTTAKAVGVVVDADDVGVVARRNEVAKELSGVISAASFATAGQVVPPDLTAQDLRKFGLWVAPDCRSNGQFDEVMRMAASYMMPDQVRISDDFITKLATSCLHDFGAYRDKAVLCSCGQLFRAGNSLASAFQERAHWADSTVVSQAPHCRFSRVYG